MSCILISTIYEKNDSTQLSIQRFNIQKLFLLVDKEAKDTQLKSIEMIEKAFGSIIEIKKIKVDLYDVVSIAKDVVEIMKSVPEEYEIYADVSQGRKPQSFGVLFACYVFPERIKEIIYWGDNRKLVILPKLSLKLNGKSKKILKKIEYSENITKLIDDLRMNRTTLYRQLKNMEIKGLIKKENGKYKTTDAGKIALLD